MESKALAQFVHFLQEELSIPAESIGLVLRQGEQSLHLLPIILWQYGLVTLEQLDRILDWLEAV